MFVYLSPYVNDDKINLGKTWQQKKLLQERKSKTLKWYFNLERFV